jgi:phage recombination protein Bet
MNAITKHEGNALALPEAELLQVLQSSLYPGAAPASIKLVIGYCKAANLDPMQKPVHIVPMWDAKAGQMRDVIMPGVNLYRTQAARSGQFAGMSEPDFGPDIEANIGGQKITHPEWCRVTVKRMLANGVIADFTAREFWMENYATKGGKEKSIAPNAMWTKRPRGQIAKCAAAQALRIAFPEIASQPTADEMEGKTLQADAGEQGQQRPEGPMPELLDAAQSAALEGEGALADWWRSITKEQRQSLAGNLASLKAAAKQADADRTVEEGVEK